MWMRHGNLLDIASRWTPCRGRMNPLKFTSCDRVKQQRVLHRHLSYSYTRQSTRILLVSMCLLHTVPYVQCDQRAERPRAIWEVDQLRRFGSQSHSQSTDIGKFLPDLIRQSKQRGWNLLDVVSQRTRSGPTERILPVDRFARSITYWLGALVAWQSLTTFVTSRDDLFEEVRRRRYSLEIMTCSFSLLDPCSSSFRTHISLRRNSLAQKAPRPSKQYIQSLLNLVTMGSLMSSNYTLQKMSLCLF